jgi:hypothetical protein
MENDKPSELEPIGEIIEIRDGVQIVRWLNGTVSLWLEPYRDGGAIGKIGVRLDRKAMRRLLLALEGVDRESLDKDEPL